MGRLNTDPPSAPDPLAYERLYWWAQTTCRGLSHQSPDHPAMLSVAMRALKDRAVLFEFALTELGNARHSAVVRGFIDALTRGGPGGTPKPMELHAHDPIRYVSDMLAWVHQGAAWGCDLVGKLNAELLPYRASPACSLQVGAPEYRVGARAVRYPPGTGSGRRRIVLVTAEDVKLQASIRAPGLCGIGI